MLLFSDAQSFRHISRERMIEGRKFVEPMCDKYRNPFHQATAETLSRARNDSIEFKYGMPIYNPYTEGSARFSLWGDATRQASEWDETPYPRINGYLTHRR